MEETTIAEAIKKGNPCVFFDVTLGGVPAGRIKLELFKSVAPKTVENFRQCVGEAREGVLRARASQQCPWCALAGSALANLRRAVSRSATRAASSIE